MRFSFEKKYRIIIQNHKYIIRIAMLLNLERKSNYEKMLIMSRPYILVLTTTGYKDFSDRIRK